MKAIVVYMDYNLQQAELIKREIEILKEKHPFVICITDVRKLSESGNFESLIDETIRSVHTTFDLAFPIRLCLGNSFINPKEISVEEVARVAYKLEAPVYIIGNRTQENQNAAQVCHSIGLKVFHIPLIQDNNLKTEIHETEEKKRSN